MPYYILTYIVWLVTFWYHITFLHISFDWLRVDTILHFYIYRWIGYVLILCNIFIYIVWLVTFWYHITFLHISFDWLHFDTILHFYIYRDIGIQCDTILHFYIYRLIGYILIHYYIFTCIAWLDTFWYTITFLHIWLDWLHFDTILHFYIYRDIGIQCDTILHFYIYRLIGYILIHYYIFTYIAWLVTFWYTITFLYISWYWDTVWYHITLIQGPPWSWSYSSWTNNYPCNQYLSQLMLWVRIHLMAKCTRFNFMRSSLSVICGSLVVFSGSSGFLHQ